MIAMHSDVLYAAKFSLVGSIGTMIEGWDAHRALERLDLAQRVYASGRLKSMLSPFLPMSKEAEEKAMQLVEQGGRLFVDELKQARGSRLKSGVDYGTGEVWSGEEALSLGLVDQIGTLDEIIAANWGVKSYDFGPSQEGVGWLTSIFQGLSQSLTESIAARLVPQMR
jgi:protease IV